MKSFTCACFVFSFVFQLCFAIEAWSSLSSPSKALRNLPKQHGELVLHFESLVSFFFSGHRSEGESEGGVEVLQFMLPDVGLIECTLYPSNLFHKDLQQRLSTLVLRQGVCSDTRQVFLSMDSDSVTSFSAAFTIPGSIDWIYVDHLHNERYRIYSKRQGGMHNGKKNFSCHTLKEEGFKLKPQQVSLPTLSATRIFRLALVANREFSLFSGNTKTFTLAAIAGILNRVNGIYMREIGVGFQLIPGNEKLLCVQEAQSNCSDLLPNNNGRTVVYGASAFIASRGISEESYDIAHVFTTGSGGLAGLGVLCTPRKAMGTTGLPNPKGDAFSVDFVSHELGHQLMGRHSFKDCRGYESEQSAMEPGSGSTIMGYAGICGTARNLQIHSDPYFHADSLQTMSEFIQRQISAQPFTCGFSGPPRTTSTPLLILSSPQSEAYTIPLGNYFQLKGFSNDQAKFFQWDHVDASIQSYLNLGFPRFRSWKPRPEPNRFFPNLYVLTHDLLDSDPFAKFERLPVVPTTLRFRFVAKREYESSSIRDEAALFGEAVFHDVQVNFVSFLQALKFNDSSRSLLRKQVIQQESTVMLYWNAGGGGSEFVEILMAENTMTNMVPHEEFDSELHIKDLFWVSLTSGPVKNTGEAMVAIPRLLSSNGDPVSVNFMLRTVSSVEKDECFAFDFVGKGLIQSTIENDYETLGPSKLPTQLPTRKPTRFPTRKRKRHHSNM